MKKCKIWLALAAISLLLCACGQEDISGNPIITEPDYQGSDPSNNSNQSALGSDQPVIIVVDDTLPPHDGMVRSRLTNEWVEPEVANTRPIAVITPNEIGAVPHYNLSKASILYEANVEGRMTRMMAIYEDWQDLEKIGNVRSLRTYFAYWAFEWDAFVVHVGGPFFINDLLEEPDTQHIDEGTDGDAFFRTNDRRAPHNAYVSGQGLLKAITKKGYSLEYRNLTEENHYQFTNKANPNSLAQYGKDAKSAVYIDMSGCYPLTRCYFEYNEEDGLYYRSQHLSSGTNEPHLDAVTGEQLRFKNILVQHVGYEDIGEGYLAFAHLDVSRDGWYFTNGRGIHINWEKTSDYGATRYYDDYGNEIILNTGKTMICIVEDGDNFTFR